MRRSTVRPEQHDAIKQRLNVHRVVRQLTGIHAQYTTVSLRHTHTHTLGYMFQLHLIQSSLDQKYSSSSWLGISISSAMFAQLTSVPTNTQTNTDHTTCGSLAIHTSIYTCVQVTLSSISNNITNWLIDWFLLNILAAFKRRNSWI